MEADTENVGYPVLPLIKQLNEMCPAEMAKYLHWGATTQDIMDTASVLQIREGLDLVEKLLRDVEMALALLAINHKET